MASERPSHVTQSDASAARRLVTGLQATAERTVIRKVIDVGAVVGAAALLAAFSFGVLMLATMVAWWIPLLVLVLLAGWPILWNVDGLANRSRAAHIAATAPVAIAVPVLVLLGIDVVWSSAGLPRPSPGLGLAFAGIVVAAAAYAYLCWVGKEAPSHHEHWAAWAAGSAVLLGGITAGQVGLQLIAIAVATGIAVWVYLLRAVGRDVRHPLWWALLLVGVFVLAVPLFVEATQGGRLGVVLLIAAAVAMAIAALNAFWIPGREKETRRILGLGGVAILVLVIIVVALQVTGDAPGAPRPRSVPAAARAAPLPQAAGDHRPILLFDSGERFRTPLDVDAMLRTGDVQLCPQGHGLLASCQAIHDPADLQNHFGNLRFDTQQIADARIGTTIYAHAVSDWLHAGWIDIDYWWYLPDNPANTAQGAMCGAGLVIPEITCFDHQSDWEGVTVVVTQSGQPEEVHYAAHSDVIDVPWGTLQAAYMRPELSPFTEGRDTANHPLVFIARGSHAAYPTPCAEPDCPGNGVLQDNSHDGARSWPQVACANPDCVAGFPVSADGADASWNVFDGYWGSAICVADGIYCARSNAPKAPGNQGRYRRPWCSDFVVKNDINHPLKAIYRPMKRTPMACSKG